jgi:hypothetical protein
MSSTVEKIQPLISQRLGASDFLPDQDSPFFMSKEEWIDLQIYVSLATGLPNTKESVRSALALSEDETFKFTMPMGDIFCAMSEHCHIWEAETYSEVISVAHRISEYATKFPARSNALRRVISQIDAALRDGNDSMTERYLVTVERLVQLLLEETQENQSLARQTSNKIELFADQTNEDRLQLIKLDKDATQEMGAADEEVEALKVEVNAIRDQINATQQEYTVSVIVAATTPAYLLVPIVGWIAIPIVAPIFGVRADQLMKAIKELRANIESLDQDIAQKVRLNALMSLMKDQIGPVREKAKAAQAIIDKAHGIWEAIAADIGSIPGTLRSIVEDGGDPDALLMQMDLDTSVDQWSKVGSAADQFRVNAFVRFDTPDTSQSYAA